MAGGSLPRGGKASYFRRLSEHVPQNIRTRVTEFIESVVFKEELEEITASVGKTVVPHEHEGKYALVDHTHASAAHTHGWPTKLSQMKDVSTLNMAVDHLLFATAYGSWVVRPPRFDAGLFGLFDEEDDTKTAVFDLSAITSGEERTVSTVDAPMTIPPTADWIDLTDGHDTTLHTHQHELLYGIGYYYHDEIDDHIDDATIHFTEDSIHHPEPVTVAVSPGPSVTLGDDVVVTGVAPVTPTHVDAVAELVFLITGEIVMA